MLSGQEGYARGMTVAPVLLWGSLAALLAILLAIDLRFFPARPSLRQALTWSIGWFALALAVAGVVWLARHGEHAALYTTVYLIERSLSLDNVFVFLLLFAYFAIPEDERLRLLAWGIGAALLLRAAAILGGLALIERLEVLVYALAGLLLLLALRMLRGGAELKPGSSVGVRLIRRLLPVTEVPHGSRLLVRERGRLRATPLMLCVGGVVFADLIFAVDSIPAAFAVTRDPFLVWMGNAFALLGMRSLFAFAEGLRERLRYFQQTIAVVLALVALKLATEDLIEIGAWVSLAVVVAALVAGVLASLLAGPAREPSAVGPPSVPDRP